MIIDPRYTIEDDTRGGYSVKDNTGQQKIVTGFGSYEAAEKFITNAPQEAPDTNHGSTLLDI